MVAPQPKAKASGQGKILVIRGGAIGDFILTLPAIAALRRQFPQAHLEVLGYPHIVQLAVAGGLVDRASSIEAQALAGFFARNGNLSENLCDYFSEFDLIVSYLYDPDQIFRTNIARCTPAQFIVGPHRPDETAGLHATRVYLQPLERLAIFDADEVPRLQFLSASVADSAGTAGGAVGPRTLALHPGSGSERKNWPEPKWLALLQRLARESDLTLLLVGGEAEGDRLRRLARALPPERLRVAQSLALPELARRLEGCTAFIGHDSGISHLAAAVSLPLVVLWADTAEAIWRPRSDKLVVLRSPAGVGRVSVEEVFERIRDAIHKP